MPEQNEADNQPGAPDAVGSEPFAADNAAEPVEMQSPEGQLPLDETPPDELAADEAALPDGDETNTDATKGNVPASDEGAGLTATEAGEVVLLLEAGARPAADEAPGEIAHSQQDEPAVELAEPGSEVESPEPPLPIKEPRRLPRAEREKVDQQRRYFAACGRCGYFVADCYLMLGEEAVQDAILDADDGWVRLEGDLTFRRLLQNAYGIQLDAGYDFFDGSCPECRRRFVFMEQTDGPTRLKIHTSHPY